ncbi:alcohol dehydrogenase catalytic domain-containing protein [Sinorhizobium meliloti]|nr:alcohol dehydrogenase catalytic domain-containing protein [Sinorhizobium meliloti]MDW9837408.1 alcohol dehydrogenase catalytic domain-containing protein [Sinorhizobium meliloti]MDX0088787.1 alcohol dehydrogenase catalytic domain-containing protein [Sinorhizobium meliloti]
MPLTVRASSLMPARCGRSPTRRNVSSRRDCRAAPSKENGYGQKSRNAVDRHARRSQDRRDGRRMTRGGQVRLVQNAIGINNVDVMVRTGLFPMRLPATLGFEAAGVIDAVGPGVTGSNGATAPPISSLRGPMPRRH